MRQLRVSKNRRFLVWDDGQPFFWLGDTAWELVHRTTIEEAEYYLENRRQKDFTVIQTVVLAELDGLNTPNVYGEQPLIDNDPLKPNVAYIRHLDRLIELAAQKGLLIGLLPTWGDKVELLGHGTGPVIFNAENARQYGMWIGNRYRDYWNIIWINGGDRSGGGANNRVWESLGLGIKTADPNHLMTFHPPGGGDGHSSAEWFHDSAWLDFNMAQSGHVRKHLPNWQIVESDYARHPVKPCLDGEPRYEDHGVNWKPAECGWFDDYDVRQAAYWAVFAGAFGHTYGCHPVWQLSGDRYAPITFARRSWKQALDLPGAFQMQHLRHLIESRPMLSRIPDPSILVKNPEGPKHCRACRGDGYMLIYLPQGGSVTVCTASLQGSRIRHAWFDPRTGQSRPGNESVKIEHMEFTAPWEGPCTDWILVIDDASQPKFPESSSM